MELVYREHLRQEYTGNSCVFSVGFLDGQPYDSVYLRLERAGEEPTIIHLRPDEMAAIAWLCTGMAWTLEMDRLEEKRSG